MTMAPCMYRGGCVVIMPKYSPEAFLNAVATSKITHVFLVPTQTIQIVDRVAAGSDLSSLRNIISAGQPLDPAVFRAVAERLPGVRLWDAYGLSEGFCTLAGPQDWAKGKHGSVGKPFILDDICIVDGDDRAVVQGGTGEICGYSVGNMKGYYKDPLRTAEMLWKGPNGRTYLRSGDLGWIDEEGYLFIQGRKKDMIKSGGINVFPVDIETAFMRHPAVAEACAIGIPHEKWIETPLLFVVLRPGQAITEEALMRWGNERLGKFQRVSQVQFLDDLPRITYGKVDKNGLRAPFWNANR
jgi:acyl-CoA synthetase (AMP-forming)/AMP-acid ligase II